MNQSKCSDLPATGKEEMLMVPKQVDHIRNTMLRTLEAVDKLRRKTNPDAESLADTWRNTCEVQDTNMLVREDLNRAQLLTDKIAKEYFRHDAKWEAELAQLLKDASEDSSKLTVYVEAAQAHTDWQAKTVRQINDLMTVGVRLANEHRQCVLQKKYYFHQSVIQQVLLAIRGVLHRRILDKELLGTISEDLDDVLRNMMPMSVTEE